MWEMNGQRRWPGPDEQDDKRVVAEMLHDRHSYHWDECLDFMQRAVYRNGERLSNDLREDVVQNAMFAVAKYLPAYRFDCRLTTWLIRIVQNRIIDMVRAKPQSMQRSVPLSGLSEEEDEQAAGPVEAPRSAEDQCMIHEELREALAEIECYLNTHPKAERNRLIVRKVLFEGCTFEEAARCVGVSPPVVGYVIRSVQRHLREKLRS